MSRDDLDEDSVFVLPDEEFAPPTCSCQPMFMQLFEKFSQLENEMRRMMRDRFDQVSKLEEEIRKSLQDRVTRLEAQVRDLHRDPPLLHFSRVKKILRRTW